MTTTTRTSYQNIHALKGFRLVRMISPKGPERKDKECLVLADQKAFNVSRTEAANCIRYARLRA